MISSTVLQQRIKEILALCQRCNDLFGQYGSEESKAAEDKFWQAIKALDKEAVKELDVKKNGHCAVGRLVKFGVADNYARYIILRVNKKVCKMVHIPYMDGYHSPAVNRDGEAWRDEIEDNLAWYDTLNEAVNRANEKQTVEQPKVEPEPELPVVAAEE